MRSHTFRRRLGVGEELTDCRGVQPLDMIEFDKSVDDQLPIGLAQNGILTKEAMPADVQFRQIDIEPT